MEWRDDGLVLGIKRLGETSVILELMTRRHGRHLGVVRGGRSRRLQPVLQTGNSVDALWRARIDEQIGTFVVEANVLRTAAIIVHAAALDGMNWLATLMRFLPERDPYPALFDAAVMVVDQLAEISVAAALLVRFELGVLAELGFGLDLGACAATGSTERLVYVSPKSGRAVSERAGKPYRERLFALPPFLKGDAQSSPMPDDIAAGFALTGHFLLRDVLTPRGLDLPHARSRFIERARSASGADRGGL